MQEQTLGDYKILRTIGQGSMGTVLLAEHRFIKKTYVLKVLPEELCADKGLMQRFEEDVARLARLDHPHIVKLHNVSFADGVYFLVTDCIVDSIGETTNLAQYMVGRKDKLREDELIQVLKQIADAIDYAHHKEGISHQMLKLNNILISKNKIGIEVVISDFGLYKIISPVLIVSRTFKVMADALGAFPVQKLEKEEKYHPVPLESFKQTKLSISFLQSFAFLAPEQKRNEKPTPSSDMWAFGILAYYLIAGFFPEGHYPRPSEIAPSYKKQWDPLVAACLTYDPEKRPSALLPLFDDGKALLEKLRGDL